MISWRATLLAGAVIGLACVDTTGMCACPPIAPGATVFGRVQAAGGAPVANATVFAYIAQADDCGRRESADGSSVTRGDGTYSLAIAGFLPIEGSCVLVRVRAPFGSAFLDAPDTTVNLSIRDAPPFDSTRVDATLGGP